MRALPVIPSSVALLLALSPAALAYEVKTTDGGEPLRWDGGALVVELALDDAPREVDAEAAEAAVRAAFAAWTAAIPDPMPLAITDLAAGGGEGEGAAPIDAHDRKNIVTWVHEGWEERYDAEALAVTLTTFDPASGRISDGDILINAKRYRWTAGDRPCQAAYDLQNVITHEVGHFFGLAHEPGERDATMYVRSGTCETKKRDLDGDDVDGALFLYGSVPAPSVDPPGLAGCRVAAGGRGGAGARLLVATLALAGLVTIRKNRRFPR